MDLSLDIKKARILNANKAYEYVRAATFGKETPQMLYELSQSHCLKKKIQRAETRFLKTPASTSMISGKKVSLSSLSKENNTLFLDVSKNNCFHLEYTNCLSENEICKIIETVKSLCINIK